MFTRILAAGFLSLFTIAAVTANVGGGDGTADLRSETRTIAPCSWSFFGDPRSVVHDRWIFTSCISARGTVLLERYDAVTRRHRLLTLRRGMERDDHNNGSLTFWRSRLWAFWAPHSGYLYPLDRRMRVEYRVSERAYGVTGGLSAIRRVPLPKGCGLGYTYPNPVVTRGRLYLFLRGPCWNPYFTSTADGRHWAKPRTLLLGRVVRRRHTRPYAKYAAGPDGSISMLFSDGHPDSFNSSLLYVRMKGRRFYRADGRLVGTVADLPLHASQLSRVHRYRPGRGRAWPMDVAVDGGRAPVALFTLLSSAGDTYWYSRWDGRRWVSHPLTRAGAFYGQYHNGGAALRHDDPSWVVLSSNAGAGTWGEISLFRTRDAGATWDERALTSGSTAANLRPVFPRGASASGGSVVVFVRGTAADCRTYRMSLVMLSEVRSGTPAGPSPPSLTAEACRSPSPPTG